MGVHDKDSQDQQDKNVWKWQIESLIGSNDSTSSAPDSAKVPEPDLEPQELPVEPESKPENVMDESDEDASLDKEGASCLVDVDKYMTGVVADEDTIIVPEPDLGFDDELLNEPQSELGASEVTDEEVIPPGVSLDALDEVDIEEDVEKEDFEVEFARELRAMEPESAAEPEIRYRVPLSATVGLFALSIVLMAVLALLIVELYNIPVPDFVLSILEMVKG